MQPSASASSISLKMATCEFDPTVELNSMIMLESVAEIAPPTHAWSKHNRAHESLRQASDRLNMSIMPHTHMLVLQGVGGD